MLKMAQIQYIKHLYETEDKSLREISRITSHSFNTVKKYAYQDNWSPDNLPNIDPQNYPTLGPFIPIIDEWLDNDRRVPRKQRHTISRIFGYVTKKASPAVIQALKSMSAKRGSSMIKPLQDLFR